MKNVKTWKGLMGKQQGGSLGWSVEFRTSCEALGQTGSVVIVGGRQHTEAVRICGGVQPFLLLADSRPSAKVFLTRHCGHTVV